MIRNAIRKVGEGLAGLLLLLFIVGFVLGVFVVVVVGGWDLLVWLTKADWRHMGFRAPLGGALVAAVSWVGAHAIMEIGERAGRDKKLTRYNYNTGKWET
jgi:hypothetical protein